MESTSSFKCCGKVFKDLVCIVCINFYHRRCDERKKGFKKLGENEVYCSYECEQKAKKKAPTRELVCEKLSKLKTDIEHIYIILSEPELEKEEKIQELELKLKEALQPSSKPGTYIRRQRRGTEEFNDDVFDAERQFREKLDKQEQQIADLHIELDRLNQENQELINQVQKGLRERERMEHEAMELNTIHRGMIEYIRVFEEGCVYSDQVKRIRVERYNFRNELTELDMGNTGENLLPSESRRGNGVYSCTYGERSARNRKSLLYDNLIPPTLECVPRNSNIPPPFVAPIVPKEITNLTPHHLPPNAPFGAQNFQDVDQEQASPTVGPSRPTSVEPDGIYSTSPSKSGKTRAIPDHVQKERDHVQKERGHAQKERDHVQKERYHVQKERDGRFVQDNQGSDYNRNAPNERNNRSDNSAQQDIRRTSGNEADNISNVPVQATTENTPIEATHRTDDRSERHDSNSRNQRDYYIKSDDRSRNNRSSEVRGDGRQGERRNYDNRRDNRNRSSATDSRYRKTSYGDGSYRESEDVGENSTNSEEVQDRSDGGEGNDNFHRHTGSFDNSRGRRDTARGQHSWGKTDTHDDSYRSRGGRGYGRRGYSNTNQRGSNREHFGNRYNQSYNANDRAQHFGDESRPDEVNRDNENRDKSDVSWRDRNTDHPRGGRRGNAYRGNSTYSGNRTRDNSGNSRDGSDNRSSRGHKSNYGKGRDDRSGRGYGRDNSYKGHNNRDDFHGKNRRSSVEYPEIVQDNSSKGNSDNYHITAEDSWGAKPDEEWGQNEVSEGTETNSAWTDDYKTPVPVGPVDDNWGASGTAAPADGDRKASGTDSTQAAWDGDWNTSVDEVPDATVVPRPQSSVDNIPEEEEVSGRAPTWEQEDTTMPKPSHRNNEKSLDWRMESGERPNKWEKPSYRKKQRDSDNRRDSDIPRRPYETQSGNDPRMERESREDRSFDNTHRGSEHTASSPYQTQRGKNPRMERESREDRSFGNTHRGSEHTASNPYETQRGKDPRMERESGEDRSFDNTHRGSEHSASSSGSTGLQRNFKQMRITGYADQDPEKRKQDQEFDSWEDNWHKIKEFQVVYEIEGNLFEQPKDFSLAHCVAEDLRMGSGIAVDFKREFKNLPDLLDQRAKQGGLATLPDKDNNRFVYYLVTKRESNGKPTYQTLWRSLNRMQTHVKDHQVTKLAIPRLGCGLDRLEWKQVKSMIEHIFKDVEIEIRVCNFQQDEEAVPKIRLTCRLVVEEYPITKIASGTLIFYFSTENGDVDDNMRGLAKKFNFLSSFKSHKPKSLGEIAYSEDKNCGLCGCIVRKGLRDPISFKALNKCVQEFNKRNKKFGKEAYEYVAFQWVKEEDYSDDSINEKMITVLINQLRNVDVYVCRGSFEDNGE